MITAKRPEVASKTGTLVAMFVEVDVEPTSACAMFSVSLLFVKIASKLPFIETAVPDTPIVGLKLVIAGGLAATTVKGAEIMLAIIP